MDHVILHLPTRIWITTVIGVVLLVMTTGGALAATLAGDDAYRLPTGQVLEDNLYVTASEIIIDGTLDGDLVAMGGYIEVNGEIRGDVLAMGGGIVINGPVAGDVRIAGGGLTLNGAIDGDLVSAGGGGAFPGAVAIPIELDGRQIQQGTHLTARASVGKDALMAGGTGVIEGTIAGTLWAAMGAIQLDGTVGGDANLYSGQITVGESAQIDGVLRYTTDSAAAPVIPGGVATSVEPVTPAPTPAAPPPSLAEQLLTWTIDVARALLGLLVVGWVLVKMTPDFTQHALAVMNARALAAFGVGLLVVLLAVPVIVLATTLAWFFWGIGGGLAVAFFLFGLLGVLWSISPAMVGLWLGRRMLRPGTGDLLAMVVGVLVLWLVIRAFTWLPVAGSFTTWLLQLITFVYAVGALIVAAAGKPATPAALTPTGPPL